MCCGLAGVGLQLEDSEIYGRDSKSLRAWNPKLYCINLSEVPVILICTQLIRVPALYDIDGVTAFIPRSLEHVPFR